MSYFLYLGFLTVAQTTNFARKRVKTRYLTLFRATKNCVVIYEQVCTSQFAIFWRNQAMFGLQTVSKMQKSKRFKITVQTSPLTPSTFIPDSDILFLCWNFQSFHLNTGGVSCFSTQAMSWTGSFRTFTVPGPWTGSKTVWIWLKIE